MVKSNEVKTYIEKLYCDNCGKEMIMSDMVLLSYPTQYIYKCPKCEIEITSEIQYPLTRYEVCNKLTKE